MEGVVIGASRCFLRLRQAEEPRVGEEFGRARLARSPTTGLIETLNLLKGLASSFDQSSFEIQTIFDKIAMKQKFSKIMKISS